MELADISFQTFLVNHPYHMKQMCYINKFNFDRCKDRSFLNQLVKTWLFPHLSYSDINDSYSHLTFSDIVEYSMFFSPIPESIGNYNTLSLYYQACDRFEESNCKVFIEHIYNNYLSYDSPEHYIVVASLIAFKYAHIKTLYELFGKFAIIQSTANQYQLTIEYIRRKLCLFIACVLGDVEIMEKAWNMLKDLINGPTSAIHIIHENCVDMIDIVETAYIDLQPIHYAHIIADWCSLDWGDNRQCIDVYISSLKAKTKLITTHSNSLSSISRFAGSLSSLLTDEEIELVTCRFKPLTKNYQIEKGFVPYLAPYLASYWSERTQYDRDSLFIYRPGLLTEEELLQFSKRAYIESDNYELYLTYRNQTNNHTGVRTNNWLGVIGYNCHFSKLAKQNNLLPENM